MDMRIILIIIIVFTHSIICYCQTIPPNANTIIVKNISFMQICNALLDAGYTIEKKDNELQTARTEPKAYPKYWNGKYRINVRVVDSVAFLSGTFTLGGGELFKDDPIYHHTNKKGKPYPKSGIGYPFILLNDFAKSLKREIEYAKN